MVDRIATVVLYKDHKDLTAHVALATVQRNKSDEQVIGKVEFKVVYDLNPFSLRNPHDLMRFAQVFCATLQSVMA